MSTLRAHGASFAYRDAVPLFESIDLQLEPGWIALVGPNGAGKTTLLRLLAGELSPTEGSVKRDGAAVLCPQRVESITPEIHALAESLDGPAQRLRAQLHLEAESLESWSTLSPGERKRWQIGAALAAEPAVLLLDEPTNHLDAAARSWLIGALRRYRGVGVLVSHDRELLAALADRTLWLQNGALRLWSLPYEAARAEREAESRQQLDRLTRAQDEVRKKERQLADARREHEAASARRSTGKRMRNKYDSDARTLVAGGRVESAQKSLGKRVGSTRLEAEKAEELASSLEIEKELGRSVFATWEPAPKNRLFALEAGEIRAGERTLLHDVSLTVSREDRIHVAGPNGAGKSTLLAALLASSQLPPERILHLPQELSTEEAEAELREVRALSPEVKGRILSILAALGVDPGRLLASESPSPGEARKLRLARGLGERAWVLVLDEPTNHLDLPSIERLEAALRAWPGALVLVTHDQALADRCCNARWQVGDGQVVAA